MMAREQDPYYTSDEHIADRETSTRLTKCLRIGSALASVTMLLACGHDNKQNEVDTIVPVSPTVASVTAHDFDKLSFNTEPTIIQLNPALPASKKSERLDPKGITLHWWDFSSGGDIEKLREVLAENKSCGKSGCSVQYAVTKDGTIYRMMEDPMEYAYHARGGNPTTFGIEIEGESEDFALSGDNFNKNVFESVVSLSAELVDDFDLQVRGEVLCNDVTGIHGHHEYNKCTDTPKPKEDPGDEYTNAVIRAVEHMQAQQ